MNFPETRGAGRATPRLLIYLAAIALIVSLGVRVYLVHVGELNEDEMDTLQRAFVLNQGERMYLDHFGLRPPWSFEAMRPLFWFSSRPSTLIVAGRYVQLLLTAAALWLFFLFVDATGGRRAAWWAVLLAAGFDFFAFRTAQVRAEPLMLVFAFGGLVLFARHRAGAASLWLTAVAGLLLGLAVMTKYSALFLALGPALLLGFDLVARRGRRAETLAALGLLTAGGLVALFGTMFFACGTGLFEALGNILRTAPGLRVSEQLRGPTWFVLHTFMFNPVFWLLGVLGFVAAHARLIGLWRDRQTVWPVGLLLLLAYLSLAMLPVRQRIFQQDMILPGLLLASLAGLLLARRLPLAASATPRHMWRAVALWLAIALPLLGATAYARFDDRRTIGFYQQVLAANWDPPILPSTKVPVEMESLLDFLRGPHDWVHYHPVRSLRQSLALADRITELTAADDPVLTQAGHGIVRLEAHRMIKTQVFADFAKYEGPPSDGVCRSLEPFLAGACATNRSPGQRAVNTLGRRPPRLIVFDYATADLLGGEPVARSWLVTNYHAWFEPAASAFFAVPKDRPLPFE